MKKNRQAFCREFQKTFDIQHSQTHAKLLLESITRASGEQIKTLAQMNDALVKALDPQLVRKALKKIANHKSTALEPQLPFAQLAEKIQQEDITLTGTN